MELWQRCISNEECTINIDNNYTKNLKEILNNPDIPEKLKSSIREFVESSITCNGTCKTLKSYGNILILEDYKIIKINQEEKEI